MNRTDSNQRVCEKAKEEYSQTLDLVIRQIVDSAYCHGYNHVLDAAEKVLDAKTYNKLTEELGKIELKGGDK